MSFSSHDASIKHNAAFFDVIKNDRTSISGEVVLRSTEQVTKPFVKKHFRLGTMPSGSNIKAGNLLKRNDLNYLVLETTENFDSEKIAFIDSGIWKTNFSGEIRRYVTVKTDISQTDTDILIESDVLGVLNEIFALLIDRQPGEIEVGKWGMFMPGYVSGEIGDQVIFNSGEIDRYDKFRIATVDKGITFTGVKFVTLENDTRD